MQADFGMGPPLAGNQLTMRIRNLDLTRRLIGIGLLFCMLTPVQAGAAEPKQSGATPIPQQIVSRLQKKYEATATLKARFEQENHLRSLGRVTRSKGRLLLSKPGRLRVEYHEPEEQLIVSNAKTLWIFTKRLNQVIVSDIGGMGSGSVPLLFLAGKGNLTQEFRIKLEEDGIPKRKGGAWQAGQPHRLSLVPSQANAGFRQMWLEVDPESYQITGLDYVDALGNKTQIRFFDIQEGAAIADKSFQFDIPSEAEVLRAPGTGRTIR